MAFYRKNIGGLHQAVRIALGVAMAGAAGTGRGDVS